jgi:hypothetical protein
MPIWPLLDAALSLITVPEPGATDPPAADAPVASGLPLMKYLRTWDLVYRRVT